MKQAAANTESQTNEISSKLDTIISRIDNFREETATDSAP